MATETNSFSHEGNINGREDIILGLNWKLEDDEGYEKCERKFRGFHLTRSKWDPYPWVGSVETGSDAEISGLRPGDCLLQIDGADVLGLKMTDIASLIGRDDRVNLQVWRRRTNIEKKLEDEMTSGEKCVGVLALEGPLPEVALKLTNAISGVVRALECPICLDSAASPVSQCVNGHILCVGCRAKSTRCPVCRVSLGQGRCLLADKCHKVLVDSFSSENTSNSNDNEYSLRRRLYGSEKISHKEKINTEKNRSHKAKNLISRIFPSIGFDDKAASTESLPVTRYSDENTIPIGRKWLLSRRSNEERLNLNDRTKSASTGELSRGNNRSVSGSLQHLINNETHGSNGYLSVPPTPLWGRSTESVTSSRLHCPLWKKTGCAELVTSGTILEHLRASHSGPMIHFHHGKAALPVPWPFSLDGIYILHQGGHIFFLQLENETIWVTGSNITDKWSWILYIRDDNGKVVTFRRDVISLQEPFKIPPQNMAHFPKNLSVQTIEIHLLEYRSDEGIEL